MPVLGILLTLIMGIAMRVAMILQGVALLLWLTGFLQFDLGLKIIQLPDNTIIVTRVSPPLPAAEPTLKNQEP